MFRKGEQKLQEACYQAGFMSQGALKGHKQLGAPAVATFVLSPLGQANIQLSANLRNNKEVRDAAQRLAEAVLNVLRPGQEVSLEEVLAPGFTELDIPEPGMLQEGGKALSGRAVLVKAASIASRWFAKPLDPEEKHYPGEQVCVVAQFTRINEGCVSIIVHIHCMFDCFSKCCQSDPSQDVYFYFTRPVYS